MTDELEQDLNKSVEERDREWLANVYRGDKEPDLTVRAVVAGMIFGGLMSLSNLYVGLKMGWGLGVDIVAVVVIYAVFKTLRGIGASRRDFGLMENTMMMTVAVAASWISSAGLISAVPALTMLTGTVIVWWKLTLFIAVILYLGLFMAIPLKRQMIQVEALRFPGNIPTGETLLVMYSQGGQAMKKAVALGLAAVAGALIVALKDAAHLIPGQIAIPLRIKSISLAKLTLSFNPSLIFLGIGALFGIKVGLSMLVGVIVNYVFLAPQLIQDKVVQHPAPKIAGIVAPQFPLAIKAGEKFTVQLEEAVAQPELPTKDELKKNPSLSSVVRTDVLSYTWPQPMVYRALDGLITDLNARKLSDGQANPLYGAIHAGKKHDADLDADVLVVDAPKAIDWEAKLSLPPKQPEGIVAALGLELGPEAKTADVKRWEEQKVDRAKVAAPPIGGFKNICDWSLWPGATILVVGGLLSLAFQWRTLGRTFASIIVSLRGNRGAPAGVLDHLEVPMSWFAIGTAVTGVLATAMLVWLFGIPWWMGVIAIVLTFFLAAVAARAGAEIGINPIGALGKVTQLTYGAIAPGNVTTNLMTAALTAGAACSCSDTVGNLKVGHMVGANPRKQFISQMFGVLAGAVMAVPAYYLLVPNVGILGGEKYPAPSALIWKGVADVLSRGLSSLPHSAIVAVVVAFVLGVIIVIIDQLFPKARPYTPSPAALGIAMTSPGFQGLLMFLGALIVWIIQKKAAKWNDMYTVPIASGCIAGESIMGVVIAALIAIGWIAG